MSTLGKKHSVATRKIQSENQKGVKNSNWKGDNVGYSALHVWVLSQKIKPEKCECCGVNPPFDAANISGEYKRDLSDWEYLCRSCHMEKDGRKAKFIESAIARGGFYQLDGRTYSIKELSEISGICGKTLRNRLNIYKWTVERSISEAPSFARRSLL